MQNKKQNKKQVKKRENKRPVRFEELLEDDRFDDEDADSVTDDTLEFLSLDDDMIESYQRSRGVKQSKASGTSKSSKPVRRSKTSRGTGAGHTKKSGKTARYVRDYDEYEDETYYGEDYEDDRYEDEAYYEEDYEDDDYETEEDYEDDDYEAEEDYEDDDYEEEEDYEDDDYEEEEDYEDDDYEEEDDYGDDYEEEEDYEDDDYEEEDDYEDDDYDDEDGVVARFRNFLAEMSTLDMVVAMLGILVVAGAVITGTIYASAKSTEKQVAAFAEVGGEIEGISVIGEGGLLAVSESARMGGMLDMDFEEEDLNWGEGRVDDEGEDENKEVEVELRLTSIQSDLKIKFSNKATGRLIGGVPFEVEVSGGGKTYDLKDDDKDGIIYQTGLSAGSYSVKMKSLEGDAYQKYKLQSSAGTVEVTDKIAYKKVDVTDEVKKESEINVAKEEAVQQNTAVESVLTDTVEWVESTKTPVGGEKDSYEEVPKDKIADPWAVTSNYRKLVETEGTARTTEGSDEQGDANETTPENPGDDNSDKKDPDNPGSGDSDNKDPEGGDKPTESEKPTDPEPVRKEVKVKLSSTSLSLKVGKSETLNVSGDDGSSYSARWETSNDSVATVSGGTVTAKAAGTATIKVKVEGNDSVIITNPELSCDVTVTVDKTDITVSLSDTSLSLSVGDTKTLNVKGSDNNSYSAEWSSSDTSVAAVSGGTVTAKAAGKAIITAKVTGSDSVNIKGSSELTCTVTVTAKKNEVEVKLSKTELSLGIDGKETLQITDGNGKAYTGSWSSSNASIAKVFEDGQVKGLKEGTATINVKVKAPDGVTIKNPDLSCKVTVRKNDYTKVTISGKSEVPVGKTLTLTAKSDPEGAEIIWSSADEKKAKVDSKGVVTGVAEGKVKIRATCKIKENIYEEIEIKVTPSDLDPATKLKDKDGNQLYYKKSSGEFVEATYKDYKEHGTFYKKTKTASEYKYTGWQTIDGFLYFFTRDNKYVTGEQVIQGAKYSFGSDGKLSRGSGSMGIDVSKHNGNIDWAAVKNSGVSYVIIRCGYRGYSTGVLVEDPMFRSNIKGAKAAGLKVGAYFFSQAVNEVEAVEEASMAIDLVKGYGLDYPLFLDVEGSGGRGDSISRDTRTAVCRTFCQTVQNSGISSGIYANKTWLNEKIGAGSLTNYRIWLAQYASAPTYTATKYDMWQYSSKGKVSGINGNVDMNISYMN